MSCDKWKYTENCDGEPCCGDCDLCDYEDDEDINVPDKPKNKVKRCFGIPIEFANRLVEELDNVEENRTGDTEEQ